MCLKLREREKKKKESEEKNTVWKNNPWKDLRGQSGPTLCSLARGTAEERSISKPGEYLIRERVYLCAVSQSQHITDGIIQQFYLFNISMTVESHYFERMRDLKKIKNSETQNDSSCDP